MRRELSLSGIGFAIYLIAVGIAAISDISAKTDFLKIIWRCYPALPILLGVDLILARTFEDSKTLSFSRPAGWIITLIILITISGFVAGTIPNLFTKELKQLGVDNFKPGFLWGFNRDYRQTLKEDFKLPPGITTICIENEFGDLKVDTGTDKTVVSASAKIKYAFQPPAADPDKVKLVGRVQDGTFLIQLQHPQFENGFLPRFIAVITIKAPPGLGIELRNSFGRINIGEVDGRLTIENSNGKLRIGKVNGDTSLITRLSETRIGEINGNLDINSTTGQIRIARVGKNLTMHHDFGNVKIGRVLGDLTVTGKNGRIDIGEVVGRFQVENNFGDVRIKDSQGPVSADVGNGNLKLVMTKVLNPLDLNVQFGNIDLLLPKDVSATLQANTSSGRIDSDFKLTKEGRTTGESMTGNINGGGSLVKIEVQNGDIHLKSSEE